MLIRYLYTMLEDAVANGVDVLGEGLTLHNTASVVEHWKSGHEVTLEASETAKVRFIERGIGTATFTKLNWLSRYHYGRTHTEVIPGAQSSLDLDSSAVLRDAGSRVGCRDSLSYRTVPDSL